MPVLLHTKNRWNNKKGFSNYSCYGKDRLSNWLFCFIHEGYACYLGWYDTFSEEGPVYTKIEKSTAVIDQIETGPEYWGIFYHAYTHPDGYHDAQQYCKFINEGFPDAPKLYMIRDSFSIAIINFLKESFSESTFRWSTDFIKEQVLESDPDVVIFEMVERKLGELLRKNIFKG